MTTNASRAPVDFDAFARDLQQPQAPLPKGAAAAQGAAKSDPLAELARIVGQDDPFRAILAARDARPEAGPGQRVEPSFVEPSFVEPSFVEAPAAQPAPVYRPVAASPTDAFDQYLASVEQAPYPIQGAEAPQAEQDAFETGERAALGRPRQRSRLVSVGAGLGVVAVCITGGLAWRGLHSGGGSSGGGVPTIMADTAPLKVAPQKADGVEIPDQNKQIYDRTAKDGQIRIVNREEQPLDVAQAARSAQGTTQGTAPGAGEGGATPGNAGTPQTGTLTESLGEPRRVRTVSVKPETPPLPPQPEAAEAPSPSVIPTMTLPGASTEGATAPGSLRPRGARVSAPLTTPTATPATETPAPVVPAPASRKAPQRVASVAPETTAAVAPPPTTVQESPAPAAGSFAVQLGVRGSASEAQAAFTQMQGKYAVLAGKPALIRQAEVNGKSLYRVRVGPLGKNEAASLCGQLKAAGGQCFVATN